MKIEPIYRNFGLRIRMLRFLYGLTQEQLSAKVKLSRVSIVNIEAGRQRILLDDVIKFSKAFRTKPSVLMRGVWR